MAHEKHNLWLKCLELDFQRNTRRDHNPVSWALRTPIACRSTNEMELVRKSQSVPEHCVVECDPLPPLGDTIQSCREWLQSDAVALFAIHPRRRQGAVVASVYADRLGKALRDQLESQFRHLTSTLLGSWLLCCSRTGNTTKVPAILIKFPSERFGQLKCEGIKGLVIAELPRLHLGKYSNRTFLAFVNGGREELGVRALRTQHEQSARFLANEIWEQASEQHKLFKKYLDTEDEDISMSELSSIQSDALRCLAILGQPIEDRLLTMSARSLVVSVGTICEKYVTKRASFKSLQRKLTLSLNTSNDIARLSAVVAEKPTATSEVIRPLCIVLELLRLLCTEKRPQTPVVLKETIDNLNLPTEVGKKQPSLREVQRAMNGLGQELFQWDEVEALVDEDCGDDIGVVLEPNARCFTAEIPKSAFRFEPEYGDRIRIHMWSAFGYWYGVSKITRRGQKRKLTKKKKQSYIKKLENLSDRLSPYWDDND